MRLAFVSPGVPARSPPPRAGEHRSSPASGGYLYNARVTAELRRLGHTVDEITTPSSTDLAASPEELGRRLATYDGVLEDELGFALYASVNVVLRRVAGHIPIVALVHVPTALLSPSPEVIRKERELLQGVSGAIFVSQATLEDTTAVLGTSVASFVAAPGWDHFVGQPAAPAQAGFHIASVGHLLPSKGTLELIDALEAFATRMGSAPWTASIAGDDAIDEEHALAVHARLASSSIASHVTLLGRCTQARIASIFASAHVFATASRYESHGIAAAEALSVGLPLVGWARGGFRQLVADRENGVLVPTNDIGAFAAALDDLRRQDSAEARERRAERMRATLPTWAHTADRIASAFTTLSSPARAVGAPDASG